MTAKNLESTLAAPESDTSRGMKMRTITEYPGSPTVTAIENKYESGFIEIGFYTPPIIPTAQPILRAVVDRLPGNRNWFLHGRYNRQARSTLKSGIVERAVVESRFRANNG